MRRWVHPQHLLQGLRNGGRVRLDQLPLLGMLVEQYDATSDQFGYCLASGTCNEYGKSRDVVVGQTLILALIVDQDGVDELVHEQSIGMVSLHSRQIEEVLGHQHGSLDSRLGCVWVAFFAMKERVDPNSDLLPLASRNPKNCRDHLDGKKRGK